ncbi:NAD(P)-binding protein [Cryphonectria parasitica EP155]|uniref:NAD(P)-binding protein n=1 Tax=Cryphonectria parasitica (strain ATCC 38755 / EP155) TaxID=660469 RepID=A0A9P4Y4Q8_CRYP1|nr:NAD(P)-binding protein [Cryphonectria parasitica EP155]KAF3766663.1 NAD(P)-binding protein [Cryphonectria parasitica EP155]
MDQTDLDAVTWPAQLTKGLHRDMYPLLEPSNPELSATGKTVLITGVSGGVGKAIAEAWATAGAAAIVITGRKTDVLEQVAAKLREIPAAEKTKIVAHAADLRSENEVQELWTKARAEVGVIDVLINDAGRMNWGAIGSIEPSEWWLDHEVNVKGTYLMIHHFIQQESSASGTIITLNTGAAGTSLPSMSSYISSKLASTRIMEILHAEQPAVRSFTLLPGLLKTAMTAEAFIPFARDDPMLSGGMTLFLSTPRADWLRGGVVSVNWDIEELEAHKDEILREGRTKLAYLNAKLQKGGHPWGHE